MTDPIESARALLSEGVPAGRLRDTLRALVDECERRAPLSLLDERDALRAQLEAANAHYSAEKIAHARTRDVLDDYADKLRAMHDSRDRERERAEAAERERDAVARENLKAIHYAEAVNVAAIADFSEIHRCDVCGGMALDRSDHDCPGADPLDAQLDAIASARRQGLLTSKASDIGRELPARAKPSEPASDDPHGLGEGWVRGTDRFTNERWFHSSGAAIAPNSDGSWSWKPSGGIWSSADDGDEEPGTAREAAALALGEPQERGGVDDVSMALDYVDKRNTFRRELQTLINRMSMESVFGDTPDYVLAEVAMDALDGLAAGVMQPLPEPPTGEVEP